MGRNLEGSDTYLSQQEKATIQQYNKEDDECEKEFRPGRDSLAGALQIQESSYSIKVKTISSLLELL